MIEKQYPGQWVVESGLCNEIILAYSLVETHKVIFEMFGEYNQVYPSNSFTYKRPEKIFIIEEEEENDLDPPNRKFVCYD